MPSCSPSRGARVVADTEKYRSSRPWNSACSTVLFPTPEGPETIKVFPILCKGHSSSSVNSSTVMPSRGARRSAARADSTTWSLSMISTEAVLRP